MTTALSIKGWKDHFQLSQNARVVHWGKLPVPIKLTGEHFRMFMATPRGREVYGVFIALAAVAANLPCRGTLAEKDGPLSDFALHVRTGIPIKALKGCIAELVQAGWLYESEWQSVSHSESETDPQSESESVLAAAATTAAAEAVAVEQQQQQRNGSESGAAVVVDRSAHSAVAVAAGGGRAQVFTILRGYWPDTETAEALADHPNASLLRVLWLSERARTEPLKRGRAGQPGFIRKGIEQGWDVDVAWINKNREKLTRTGVLARVAAG